MIDRTIATITFIGYGIICVIGIIGMLMYLHKKKRNYMVLLTLLLGAVGCVFAIPTYTTGLVITGITKYILGSICGITVAFAPLLVVDCVVIKLQNMYKKYARKKQISNLLYK